MGFPLGTKLGRLTDKVRAYMEVGSKRTFASAADWPGWCRAGKTEAAALATLAAYAPRYARVARLAGISFSASAPAPGEFEVVERLPGNATTDFGAPGVPAEDEKGVIDGLATARMCALVEAGWAQLDAVVAKAPSALRKGPRGGGRDRDAMYDHVLGAEMEYAKRIGMRLKQPDGRDRAAVAAFRSAVLESLSKPNRAERWPVRYAARRTAWHALDHAWEIEDRIP